MVLVRIVFLLISGLILTSGSDGAFATVHPSGKQFYSFCTVTTETPDGDEFFARCENYVHEIRQELARNELHGYRACIPVSVPNLSLINTALKWINIEPKRHHMDPDEALAMAFSEKWPCI